MRYALSGKNGKACKRTRVIPYVRIRNAFCCAAANGCVCGKLNRSRQRFMRQNGTNSDGGSWGIREYDVRVGYFLSLRQKNYAKKQNIDEKPEQFIELVRKHLHLNQPRLPAVFSSLIVRF